MIIKIIFTDKLMPTSFEKALTENDYELVCNCLTGNRPIPINIRNKASLTGLMIACQSKADATLQEILEINTNFAETSEKKADLNATDCMGWTALHYAAKSGSLECVKLLIKNGAKIDQANVDDQTPLRFAAQSGHFDCMKYLLDNGAELNKKNQYGSTVLHFAVMGGNSECINYLIDNGLDLNKENMLGISPLQGTVVMGRLETLKCLIAKKADCNEKHCNSGESLLHFAARGANLQCLQHLIELGADVNARDKKCNTPLHSVGNYGHPRNSESLSVAAELIRAGADPTAVNCYGDSPLKNRFVKIEFLRLRKP